MASTQIAPVNLPRVAITYCTQCRWMLRAAYFGQELLSTFGTQIGEIALIPATGGLFQVELTYLPPTSAEDNRGDVQAEKVLLWDRKTEGGFPETKVLKQKVRDRIDPKKDLGHSDVGGKKKDAVKFDEGKSLKAELKPDVKVDGPVERIAEDMVKDLQIEDASDEVDAKKKESVRSENGKADKDEIAAVKVDGRLERNAEDVVKDMELEDVQDTSDVKRNPDGTVCEDCR